MCACARVCVLGFPLVACLTTRVVASHTHVRPQPGYNPYVPPAAYAELLAAVYPALKAVTPSATVVLGGLASGAPAYVTQVRSAAGGKLPVDAVGVHPYGRRPDPSWPSPTWGFGALTPLMQQYAAVSSPLPTVITEIGTNVLSAQAEFPQRTFVALASNATVTACHTVFWFCWSDGMVSPFGLVTATGAPKPSYYSFSNYTHGV